MNEQKILSLLGLATKAGKLAHGDSAVKEALLKGKAFLVITAGDCGENTREKVIKLCETKKTEIVTFSTKKDIGKAVGRDDKAVVALLDDGFAGAVKKLFEQ